MMTTALQYIKDKELSSSFEQTLTHSNMWERFHSKPYEQTEEDVADFRDYMQFGNLSQVFQDEETEVRGVEVTKQSAKAIPLVYFEDSKKTINAPGFKDARLVAKERGIKVQEFMKKSSFHMNRHVNIIIFSLDDTKLYQSTWKMIYNAMMNNKTVMAKCNGKVYQNIKPDTNDFNQLAQLFKDSKQARIRRMQQENNDLRQSKYGNYELTLDRAIVLEVFKQLYEIEGTEVECLAMVNHYLKARMEPTRILSYNSPILDNMRYLPLEVLEWMAPMFNFKTDVQYYGNEDMFVAHVIGTLDSYEDESY